LGLAATETKSKLRGFLDEPHFLIGFVLWFYPIAFLLFFGLLLGICNQIAFCFGAPLYSFVPRYFLTVVCYISCLVFALLLFRFSSWMRRTMFYLITLWLLTCAVFDVTGPGFSVSLERAAGRPMQVR
jgi:hypothetical protein